MSDFVYLSMNMRPAKAGEHVALTELALRSVQRAWKYDDEFMAWEPEAIVVEARHIEDEATYVLESDGRLLGFYVLKLEHPNVLMSRLMVEPEAIGMGLGRLLWEHAIETARGLGGITMVLDADPNAEPFYRRMGAVTVGEHDWEPPMMPGWRLKKMVFPLAV